MKAAEDTAGAGGPYERREPQEQPLRDRGRRRPSRLTAVAGRDAAGDAALLAAVAGRGSAKRAREALATGATLHDLVEGTAGEEWPAAARRRLDAAVALVRRSDRSRAAPERLENPEDVVRYLTARHLPLATEHFGILVLTCKHTVLEDRTIGIGTVSTACVDRLAVARTMIDHPTAVVASWHNHPSGNPAPSAEDLKVWEAIDGIAKLLGVETLDHLIVTHPGGPWYSRAAAGHAAPAGPRRLHAIG